MKTIIHWDQLLETGLEKVDRHHRHLLDLTNHLGERLATDQVRSSDIDSLYQELVDYTRYHFEEEEKIIVQAGIDRRHLAHHQLEHQGFLDEVTELYRKHPKNTLPMGGYLFDFLLNWLIYHILGPDMSMARQAKAIQEGKSAAAAFQDEEHTIDRSTALLLRSLKNLFQQVSARNRELVDLNHSLEQKIKNRTRELERANSHLNKLASTDALTGLVNRRRALEILRMLWLETSRNQQPLSCMMIDADNFKQINDRYGHDAGDEVLRVLAREMVHAVRTDDIVCRLGGDEFMLICPATDTGGALHLAETLHRHIVSLRICAGAGTWQGSVSIGIATRSQDMTGIEDLIKAADRRVYLAKAAGRNCIRAGSSP